MGPPDLIAFASHCRGDIEVIDSPRSASGIPHHRHAAGARPVRRSAGRGFALRRARIDLTGTTSMGEHTERILMRRCIDVRQTLPAIPSTPFRQRIS
jgi:hypothetical protein